MPALAQAPATISPSQPVVSMDEARRIAAGHGIVRIEDIRLDNGEWKVEGRDSTGAGIEIKIKLRASDGVVVKMERKRPASARAGQN